MPRRPNTYPYHFYYKDGTYLTMDITKTDFRNLVEVLTNQVPAVELSIGILCTSDIRSVIEMDEPEEAEVPQNKGLNPEHLDWETKQWLKEHEFSDLNEEDDVH